MSNVDELVQLGYRAYGDTVRWKNAAGLDMPEWQELPEKQRAAWREAIRVVQTKMARDMGSEPDQPPA